MMNYLALTQWISFKQYKMPLVDYKNFNYNNAVILPYSKHGEYLIGDTYNFYWTKEEFVVSGFYDDSIQYNFDDAENTFINKEVVFTSNDNLLELLEYNNTLISHSKLNNIEFVFNDYDKYKEFKANFNKQFLSFYDGTILLISSLDEIIINKINDSFLLIKLFLIIIAFVAIMIMYSFIVLLFNQNKRNCLLYIL